MYAIRSYYAISETAADEIIRFIAITGTNAAVLTALEAYKGRNNAA